MLKTFALALLVSGAVAGSSGHELRSTALVRELTGALAAAGRDAVAAQHPDEPDGFIAALSIPGAQLLVVSARFSSPEQLRTRLALGQHREVYLDLQGAAIAGSSWFLQDMSGDGLCMSRDQSPDVLYDGRASAMVFDGDWKGHDLSEKEYSAQLTAADEHYSRLLDILLAQMQQS